MKKMDILPTWGAVLTGHRPFLSIEITRECPLCCPGCYAYDPEHLGEKGSLRSLADLKDDALVKGVVDLVQRLRPIHLSIIGGEPLARYRELGVLLPILDQMGLEVQLVTSAVRPIPAEWSQFANLHISVSIDGLQPEHDQRRTPATYERVLKHIAGHRVVVHCTVTRQQLQRPGYLVEFAAFWSQRAEVRKIWFSLYTPQEMEQSEERLRPEDRSRAITVKLTDEFMEAVQRDFVYPLRAPRGGGWEGNVTDPRGEIQAARLANGNGVGLPARKVRNRIVENAWRSAEPGIAFIDRINRDNPVKSLGAIRSSNPCGEYWQVDYNSCNLGSINLARVVREDKKAGEPWSARIDGLRLRGVARAATRFLDHVITASQYPVPEIREVTAKSRPVGLGVMGYADMLLKLGIRYGSPDSIAVAEKVMRWVQYWAWVESAELAKEFTPFPELDRNRDYFDDQMGRLTKEFTDSFSGPGFPELGEEAGKLENLYRQWGVRNCHVTVQSPTGSISLIAECSSGIEPIFAFEYQRHDSLGTRSYRHPALEEWRQANPGQPLPDYFVDASAIKPEEHILIQAAFQKYVDNAVSKTANLQSNAGPEDVEKIYWLAYENGLKSVTVYVEGSREGVLLREPAQGSALHVQAITESAQPQPAADETVTHFIARPEFLRGTTRKIRTPFGTVFVTVNYDVGARQVTEIFVRESSGNEAWELVGRLLSLLLRARVPMEKILSQLYRTRGQNTIIRAEAPAFSLRPTNGLVRPQAGRLTANSTSASGTARISARTSWPGPGVLPS